MENKMELVIDIPIRRQTYENIEDFRKNQDVFSTPVRPNKDIQCPGAPERKINVFNPVVKTQFSVLNFTNDRDSPFESLDEPPSKRRRLNNGEVSVLVSPISQMLYKSLSLNHKG